MSGTRRRRWTRCVVVTSVFLASGTSLITTEVDAATRAELTLDRPNIVVILTDDQRWDQLQAMPTLENELQAKGRSFTNAFTVDPLCCPSRVALLRGEYPHSTGIYRNSGSLGGASGFLKNGREQTTLATMLDGAGYRTALVGKYLNGYTTSSFTRVPPGWDEWRAFSTSGAVPYFNYPMSVNGQTVSYGSDPEDYATDVLAGYADEFIRSTPIDEPLFLYLSTGAPHTPMTPAPRHQTSAACPARQMPPSVGETDVTDKPSYIAKLGWTSSQQKQASKKWVKSCKTLLAVDDAVSTVLNALEDTERLGDTLIVYVSDNGFLFGEHRYFGKKVPYDESIRLPMVVRYDPITGGVGVSDDRLVINIDITATALDLAGVVAPYPLEGESLLPALAGDASPDRDAILVEHYDPPTIQDAVPTYCAVRTAEHSYVRYDADFEPVTEELYDVQADPYQLDNLMRVGEPPLGLRDDLLQRMQELCVPVPPSFDYDI